MGGAAHAVANDQARELSVGPWGQASLDFWVAPWFAVGPALHALGLSAGQSPKDSRLAPRDGASLFGIGLSTQFRPFSGGPHGHALNASGFWLGGGVGVAQTGQRTRAFINTGLGFDFWAAPTIGLGPMIGVLYVPQPDDSVRPDDAVIGLAGLHVTFDPALLNRKKAFASTGDQDGDGIVDERDACPEEAEDKDGYQDNDGCPDLDNDGDGIPDTRDKCPNEPEDRDGFQDEDGCPDLDNDRDGIPDARDICSSEPEDFDGFQDEDGCPDPDNDQDGILDSKDQCPNEPETKNGYADEDGCPDEESIRVVGDEILLDDRIYFQMNMAYILPRSFKLLGRLASFLEKHPEYIRVSIEGHTDETGAESYNQRLSQARADAVRTKLIALGLTPSRLTVVGYGEGKPQVVGKGEIAHQKNRRVEFRVTRRTMHVEARDQGAKP